MPSLPASPSLLSAVTKLGKVELIVSDLQGSLKFYSGVIGLQILVEAKLRAAWRSRGRIRSRGQLLECPQKRWVSMHRSDRRAEKSVCERREPTYIATIGTLGYCIETAISLSRHRIEETMGAKQTSANK